MATRARASALAAYEDLDVAYEGDLDPQRRPYYDALLARAQRLLVARRPGLLDHVGAGRVAKDNVVDAIVTACLRVVRNPGGMQSETEGSYLYSVQRDVAGGKLYFTGDDLALLDPAPAAGRTSRPGTIGVRLGLGGVPW